MFGKIILFASFEMIQKKKSEDHVLGFGLRVGYDGAGRHM